MSSISDLAGRKIEEQSKALKEVYERRAQELRKAKEDALNEVKRRLSEAAKRFTEEVSS